MTARRVLVVGGSGYVGGQVVRALCARPDVEVVATWCRSVPAALPADLPADLATDRATDRADGHGPVAPRWVAMDLTEDESVRRTVGSTGPFDAVVHCGHAVQGPAARMAAVNHDGAGRLCEALLSAGSPPPRLVALSTASVHGPGPWRLLRAAAPVRPASVVSRTRADGDDLVRQAGGVVVRPHLVTDSLDPYFGPLARRLVEQLGWPGHGTARHTVTTAAQLALGMVTLALTSEEPGGAVLAGHETLTLRQLLTQSPYGAPGLPEHGVDVERALAMCPPGVPADRWRHDIELATTDHVLDLGPWRRLTGGLDGPSPTSLGVQPQGLTCGDAHMAR